MKKGTWTPEDLVLLESMVAKGVSLSSIARAFGRDRKVISTKLHYLRNNEKGRPGAGNVVKVVVPAAKWEERDRRLAAPQRDLTGTLMGDPPLGYSALERRT